MKTVIRMFIIYRPFKFFIILSCISAILGMIPICRFLYFYIIGNGNGHVQSLILSVIFLLASMQLVIIAIVGELMSINRKLLEDIQTRLKKLEFDKNKI